jgi:Putative DNA-binding domain
MPTLLETQRALRRELFGSTGVSHGPLGGWCAGDAAGAALLLGVYRNTCVSVLLQALRLSFPAVWRLVGEDFFAAGARAYLDRELPTGACLNDFGASFPRFIGDYAPAASLSYLADVAALEWAVNRALHADERVPLDPARLVGLDASALPRVAFHAHPALSLLALQTPADAIWRAVIDQDEPAMAAIDLASGPVHLLIERDGKQLVQVLRLRPRAWRLTERLCAGVPLYGALDAARTDAGATAATEPDTELHAALADHLVSGRFVDFQLRDWP